MGSMIDTFYRQCLLVKGRTIQVAWIPEDLAKEGKYIQIKKDNGWFVEFVSSSRKIQEEVLNHERDHLYHRNRTDI